MLATNGVAVIFLTAVDLVLTIVPFVIVEFNVVATVSGNIQLSASVSIPILNVAEVPTKPDASI